VSSDTYCERERLVTRLSAVMREAWIDAIADEGFRQIAME
jgi:hypothetical protein